MMRNFDLHLLGMQQINFEFMSFWVVFLNEVKYEPKLLFGTQKIFHTNNSIEFMNETPFQIIRLQFGR